MDNVLAFPSWAISKYNENVMRNKALKVIEHFELALHSLTESTEQFFEEDFDYGPENTQKIVNINSYLKDFSFRYRDLLVDPYSYLLAADKDLLNVHSMLGHMHESFEVFGASAEDVKADIGRVKHHLEKVYSII